MKTDEEFGNQTPRTEQAVGDPIPNGCEGGRKRHPMQRRFLSQRLREGHSDVKPTTLW